MKSLVRIYRLAVFIACAGGLVMYDARAQAQQCSGTDSLDKCKFQPCFPKGIGICKNTPGRGQGYACSCPPGLELLQGSRYCGDVNECNKGTHNCHPQAQCNNLPYSFECSCREGWVGDGQNCIVENKCTTNKHNCHAKASCSFDYSSGGSFTCACNRGFFGNGTSCDSWGEIELIGSDTEWGDFFGKSVSMSGDGSLVLASSHWDTAKAGSAYLFKISPNGTVHQASKLSATDGEANDNFGLRAVLSYDGSTALLGAHQDDDRANDAGSAYVFKVSPSGAAVQVAKLTASDGASADWFGKALSLSADGATALVGAEKADDRGNESGSAYIFKIAANGAATQTAKLTAGDGGVNHFFGDAVTLSADGSTALIGAHQDDMRATDSGAVYLFKVAGDGTATQAAKITASDGSQGDWFGKSVALSADGSFALVGAEKADVGGNDAGSAYVFKIASNGDFAQTAKLTADDKATNDFFGKAVSLSASGSVALVGATGNDDPSDSAGAAYIFKIAADGSAAQASKLTASNVESFDKFGDAVTLGFNGSMACVGSENGEKVWVFEVSDV